ncbi:hypothetical protein V6Z12_D03G099100 [Gossypium hirsutum]
MAIFEERKTYMKGSGKMKNLRYRNEPLERARLAIKHVKKINSNTLKIITLRIIQTHLNPPKKKIIQN